jgi:hypothetical protein
MSEAYWRQPLSEMALSTLPADALICGESSAHGAVSATAGLELEAGRERVAVEFGLLRF